MIFALTIYDDVVVDDTCKIGVGIREFTPAGGMFCDGFFEEECNLWLGDVLVSF